MAGKTMVCAGATTVTPVIDAFGPHSSRGPPMIVGPPLPKMDPFEPQPDGVDTIFPFHVQSHSGRRGFIELPYTLAQDFTLFVLLREKSIDIWKRKAAWVVHRGGMLLLNTHPDYMSFDEKGRLRDEYDVLLYEKFLLHIRDTYKDAYWHALPREVAHWWNSRPAASAGATPERNLRCEMETGGN